MAYSIVSPDEVSYVLDLHLFLGRPLKPVVLKDQKGKHRNHQHERNIHYCKHAAAASHTKYFVQKMKKLNE